MVMQYHWVAVSPAEEPSLVEKLNAATSTKILKEGRTHVSLAETPFYTNMRLARATTYATMPPVTMHFLVGGAAPDWTVVRMNGTKDPVFKTNAAAGLVLNKDTVVAYLTFVLGEIQSEEGTLRLVEQVDDDTFSKTPTPEERKTVTHLIRPAKVAETADGFTVDAIVLYGDAVFYTALADKKDCTFDIVKDEKLAENLPIRPVILE